MSLFTALRDRFLPTATSNPEECPPGWDRAWLAGWQSRWPVMTWRLDHATVTATGNWVSFRDASSCQRFTTAMFGRLRKELATASQAALLGRPSRRAFRLGSTRTELISVSGRSVSFEINGRPLAIFPAETGLEIAACLRLASEPAPFTKGSAGSLHLCAGAAVSLKVHFTTAPLTRAECRLLAAMAFRVVGGVDSCEAEAGESRITFGPYGTIPLTVTLTDSDGIEGATPICRAELAQLGMTLAAYGDHGEETP